MAKHHHPPVKKLFWIFFILAFIGTALIFAYTLRQPSADVAYPTCGLARDYAFLIDNSGSADNQDGRARAVRMFGSSAVGKMQTGSRSAVLTFSYTTPTSTKVIKQGLDSDLTKSVTAVQNLNYNGDSSSARQGVDQTSAYLRIRTSPQPGVVLLAVDAEAVVNDAAIAKAQEDFAQYGIRYYTLNIGGENATQKAQLQQLAASAGGQYYRIRVDQNQAAQQTLIDTALGALFADLAQKLPTCSTPTPTPPTDPDGWSDYTPLNQVTLCLVSKTATTAKVRAKITFPDPNASYRVNGWGTPTVQPAGAMTFVDVDADVERKAVPSGQNTTLQNDYDLTGLQSNPLEFSFLTHGFEVGRLTFTMDGTTNVPVSAACAATPTPSPSPTPTPTPTPPPSPTPTPGPGTPPPVTPTPTQRPDFVTMELTFDQPRVTEGRTVTARLRVTNNDTRSTVDQFRATLPMPAELRLASNPSAIQAVLEFDPIAPGQSATREVLLKAIK